MYISNKITRFSLGAKRMLLSSEITKNNILLLWFLPKANEMDVTDTRAMQGNSLVH